MRVAQLPGKHMLGTAEAECKQTLPGAARCCPVPQLPHGARATAHTAHFSSGSANLWATLGFREAQVTSEVLLIGVALYPASPVPALCAVPPNGLHLQAWWDGEPSPAAAVAPSLPSTRELPVLEGSSMLHSPL